MKRLSSRRSQDMWAKPNPVSVSRRDTVIIFYHGLAVKVSQSNVSQPKVSQPEDLQTGNQPGSTILKQGGRCAKVEFTAPLRLFSFTRNHFQKGKTPRCPQVRDYIN